MPKVLTLCVSMDYGFCESEILSLGGGDWSGLGALRVCGLTADEVLGLIRGFGLKVLKLVGGPEGALSSKAVVRGRRACLASKLYRVQYRG